MDRYKDACKEWNKENVELFQIGKDNYFELLFVESLLLLDESPFQDDLLVTKIYQLLSDKFRPFFNVSPREERASGEREFST